jgi:hypothetical protein
LRPRNDIPLLNIIEEIPIIGLIDRQSQRYLKKKQCFDLRAGGVAAFSPSRLLCAMQARSIRPTPLFAKTFRPRKRCGGGVDDNARGALEGRIDRSAADAISACTADPDWARAINHVELLRGLGRGFAVVTKTRLQRDDDGADPPELPELRPKSTYRAQQSGGFNPYAVEHRRDGRQDRLPTLAAETTCVGGRRRMTHPLDRQNPSGSRRSVPMPTRRCATT